MKNHAVGNDNTTLIQKQSSNYWPDKTPVIKELTSVQYHCLSMGTSTMDLG